MRSQIEIKIALDGPISHNEIGKDMGNVTLFRRMARVVDGRVLRVPILSAGALRGVLRRLLWRETFDICGLSRESMGTEWDRLYAALANGGTIEGAETRVSPDVIRARRKSLPVLSLLGSALYTSHMAGRLMLSHAWLDCAELGTGPLPMEELLTEISTVRHADGEEQNPDVSRVGPMPSTVEVVVAGAAFRATATVNGDIEAGALVHGLGLIRHLGGKSGQGNGAVTLSQRGGDDGDTTYAAWLTANVDQVRADLCELAGQLAPRGKGKGKGKGRVLVDVPADDGASVDPF